MESDGASVAVGSRVLASTSSGVGREKLPLSEKVPFVRLPQKRAKSAQQSPSRRQEAWQEQSLALAEEFVDELNTRLEFPHLSSQVAGGRGPPETPPSRTRRRLLPRRFRPRRTRGRIRMAASPMSSCPAGARDHRLRCRQGIPGRWCPKERFETVLRRGLGAGRAATRCLGFPTHSKQASFHREPATPLSRKSAENLKMEKSNIWLGRAIVKRLFDISCECPPQSRRKTSNRFPVHFLSTRRIHASTRRSLQLAIAARI